MNYKIKSLVGTGIFTAIVFVLQLLGGGIRFGMFSITLVLVPIVVGSAVYNWKPKSWFGVLTGAWLGFIFGFAVLVSGDAAAFMAINVPATIYVVLLKGIVCGAAAGLVYRLLEKFQKTVAVFVAAIICPTVNSLMFFGGCLLFFMDDLSQWAVANGYTDTTKYIIFGLIGVNFLIELGTNIALAPIIARLIRISKR